MAIFAAHIRRQGACGLITLWVGQGSVEDHHAPRPTKAILATQFIAEAKHHGALFDVSWNQRRRGCEAFHQVKLLTPRAAWPFVVPDRDRCAALTRPGL